MSPHADRVARLDDERTVAYAEYGDPSGRPLLALHGTPGSRVFGELFDDVARERGVRVIAPDRPGFGRSPAWSDRTLTDTETFVSAVLDDVGAPRASVVGFSGGGPHALALAATAPRLVETVAVVAGATPPSLRERTPRAQRMLAWTARSAPPVLRALSWIQVRIAARASPSLVLGQYTDDPESVPSTDADAVRRDFLAALRERRTGLVRELRLLAEPWEFAPGDVDVPVHLWHGARDANAPVTAARRLADELPDSSATFYDDADHLTTLLRSRSAVVERLAQTA